VREKQGTKIHLREKKMKKSPIIFVMVMVLFALGLQSHAGVPLKLIKVISLPGLKEGDFDHFAVDLEGHRLFLCAEENFAIEVLDLTTNKLIHTISDVKVPHSMVYRADLKKLYVVDGGAAELKIFDTDSYKSVGSIKLTEDADSNVFDPSTKYMYIVNGGDGAHMTYSFVSVIDTTAATKLADIKIDSDSVEAMALEASGPRLFVNITGKDVVGVFDREKREMIATWPTAQVAKHLTAMKFDEADHRLFVTTRNPGKFIVLDSDSGKVVASLPTMNKADELSYDASLKRIYVQGTLYIDVFQQGEADHYSLLARVPGAASAKTAILVPELHRYYLAVPRHGQTAAAVRVYEVVP
jgi:DNA-binding beta-propeller fold protein YncE